MVYSPLAAFGAPLQRVSPEDFTVPGNVYQIGVSPLRVDVLVTISGVEFAEAWAAREMADFDGVRAHVISRSHLIVNKLATGRPRDRMDARLLSRAEPGARTSKRRAKR